jgi:hypothetical protein
LGTHSIHTLTNVLKWTMSVTVTNKCQNNLYCLLNICVCIYRICVPTFRQFPLSLNWTMSKAVNLICQTLYTLHSKSYYIYWTKSRFCYYTSTRHRGPTTRTNVRESQNGFCKKHDIIRLATIKRNKDVILLLKFMTVMNASKAFRARAKIIKLCLET